MHLLHGLSIDAIGSSFRVHRATAARWLGSIRAKLDRETRRLLRERKGLTDPEFDSLVRLVESRIQVSFRRVLGSAVGG
jgi:RNA polymerase sigma-70 factor (ECF subfamily)